jgi:hypothetical protein
VYNFKRNLKNDADRIFITENLTKTRTNLAKSLADLKYNQNIKTSWTCYGIEDWSSWNIVPGVQDGLLN